MRGETYVESGKPRRMKAKVLRVYRRWALVQTEAGYKTAVWVDEGGMCATMRLAPQDEGAEADNER